MKTTLSAQQHGFYTKNGYLELELPHKELPLSKKRDQWREDKDLLHFLKTKLGHLALLLSGKTKLRLGMSEWIVDENRPKTPCKLKEMCSLQAHEICAVLSNEPLIPEKKSSLGVLPLPSNKESVLFFRSNLILDWPHVHSDVFLVVFTLHNGIYIENKNDPETHYLKELGYFFGDSLKNETHPLIL